MDAITSRLVNGLKSMEGKKFVGPVGEVAEGEVVIGKLTNPELRRFFMFRERLNQNLCKKIEDARELLGAEIPGEHNSETCPRCKALAETFAEKEFVEAVSQFFWAAVKDSLFVSDRIKIHKAGGMGLREGWKIVALAPDRGNVLADLITIGILGGLPLR